MSEDHQQFKFPNSPSLKLQAALIEGAYHATLPENFARAVIERMLPALQLTPDEVNTYIQADLEWHGKRENFPNTWSESMAFRNDYSPQKPPIPEFEMLNYARMQMSVMWYHTLSLAFASLFHLFERQLQTVLYQLIFRQLGANYKWPVDIRFNDLQKLLKSGGYAVSEPVAHQIDRLNLITNVVKHASRKSLITLEKNHPTLFHPRPMNAPLSLEQLLLTTDLFTQMAEALGQFWREFPHDE